MSHALPGMQTTGMCSFVGDNEVMTGDEVFELFGDLLTPEQLQEIIHECKGLKVHWDCIDKARAVRRVLKTGTVVVGSLMVTSGDGQSEYGYYFRPPWELHAWVYAGYGIIDVALPGVINKGLNTRDNVGPYLVGRKPVVLAGAPADWMRYKPHEYLEG